MTNAETTTADSTQLRRKLPLMQKLLVAAAILFGLFALLAGLAGGVEREDLTKVSGLIHKVEPVKYWDDVVLYVEVAGTSGRFKYEKGYPGYDAFEAAAMKGVPVELWVETFALETKNQPAPIFEAIVDGTTLIHLESTQAAKNDDNMIVIALGVAFILLGFWIWHRATRPLPTQEETDAYEARLLEIAEKHPRLFAVMNIVTTIREWGESIPKLGDLFTAFLFFWILPLYMLFICVTAQSYRWFITFFCFSYWFLLVSLMVAAVALPDFPGADEFPILGPVGSKLFHTYLILNIAYGGAIWIWGTLMYEPEPAPIEPEQPEAPEMLNGKHS